MKRVKIISIESDFGAGEKGAKLGPQALLKNIERANIPALRNAEIRHIVTDGLEVSSVHPFVKDIEAIIEIQKKAVEVIGDVLDTGDFPFIISGDHSNGAAGISAIRDHFPDKRIGVIWIDAHADIHNPFSTPSGNMHGMPLAVVLGLKHEVEDKNELSAKELQLWQELLELGDKKINPKIRFSDLVYIELRDFEEDEMDTIGMHGIKYFTPQKREEIGLVKVLDETLEHLKDCDLLYISFDVDSLDPEISVGTGTPVRNGLSKQDAIFLLKDLLSRPKTAV